MWHCYTNVEIRARGYPRVLSWAMGQWASDLSPAIMNAQAISNWLATRPIFLQRNAAESTESNQQESSSLPDRGSTYSQIGVIGLLPLALCARWSASSEQWSSALQYMDVPQAGTVWASVLKPLHDDVIRTNAELCKVVASGDVKALSTPFRIQLNGRTSTHLKWLDKFLRVLLFAKLLWSFANLPVTTTAYREERICCLRLVDDKWPHRDIRNAQTTIEEWREVIADVTTAWKQVSNAAHPPARAQGCNPTMLSKDDLTVSAQLLRASMDTSSSHRFHVVKSNLCMAALGLYAVLKVGLVA